MRVMFLEYAPRISGTRHGFKVRKGIRRCYRVCVIVLGCAPGVLEYAKVTHRVFTVGTRHGFRVRIRVCAAVIGCVSLF